MCVFTRRKPKVARLSAMFLFHYEFADGSKASVRASTPGDARAALKKRRGGKLPKVINKWREPA